ncbi:penicillin-binding protein [Sediminibacterium soli]|uniref:penicillin-binding protein n=1 Tax=Sediminibacterium soli TaxID=2698829 RepID=UPI00137B6711|nr:penicillin-binding protein [Sediminibacterium soli]NCI48032.1 transpeptidase family protein [Sediminibacterium soli]
MDVKRDILWRVYLSYILVVVACVAIFGKAIYIQQVQGAHWRSMSDSLHLRMDEIEAERGTIYSEDGQMLSTSIPQFDIYMDFRVDALREKNGQLFRNNIDSLSHCLAALFQDQTAGAYKTLLQQGYKNEEGYFLLHKKASFREYEQLRKFPLFRLGRYKSGMIANEKTIRLNPYQMLAFRTIGLARDSNKVGLEMTYDSLLRGRNGKRTVRTIAGGVSVPVDDTYEIEPETGKDIVSTIDVFIQDIAENALMKMLVKNDAQHGCVIVMEVKTGKIKAIANLGKRSDGTYWEDYNYAISPTEPGSTFKLATMMALLEDKKVTLNQGINLEHGAWKIAGQTVYDSEVHKENETTVQHSFELSSNVAMAKLASIYYSAVPNQFIRHLKKMRMDTLTGIDLRGEGRPVIYKPGGRFWGPTTLPWMAFGYNLSVTPLQTTTLYNAVANNGKMMRPYLVSAVKEEGVLLQEFAPAVIDEKLCSDITLKQLQTCLEGVCTNGTAKELFKGTPYQVAGKTGTALVADGNRGYADKIYQSSFAGYFPAENPQYTCVVIIKNKPHAAVYYGGSIAGPVFKEIADRLYSTYILQSNTAAVQKRKTDSTAFAYSGSRQDMALIASKLSIGYTDSTNRIDEWTNMNAKDARLVMNRKEIVNNTMPQLKGMGLKDVVYLCENMGLRVTVKGKGKVSAQSVQPGQMIAKGQLVNIELN